MEERKPDKVMQRAIMHMALSSIKQMVESGSIIADYALSLVGGSLGYLNERESNPDFVRFRKMSRLVYKDEPQSGTSYPMYGLDGAQTGKYKFGLASNENVNMLFKLHQNFSGKSYETPKQLKSALQKLLEGKRVLELGCGPGHNLAVIKRLGARVSGVELRKECKDAVPDVDVRHGDAECLDEIFGDERFDMIYSKDLFCTAVLQPGKSERIAASTYRHTADGGMGLHHINYTKIPLPMFLLHRWIANREAGVDPVKAEDDFWELDDKQRDDALWTNRCSIDPQYLVRQSFTLKEYVIDNGELNMIVKK